MHELIEGHQATSIPDRRLKQSKRLRPWGSSRERGRRRSVDDTMSSGLTDRKAAQGAQPVQGAQGQTCSIPPIMKVSVISQGVRGPRYSSNPQETRTAFEAGAVAGCLDGPLL